MQHDAVPRTAKTNSPPRRHGETRTTWILTTSVAGRARVKKAKEARMVRKGNDRRNNRASISRSSKAIAIRLVRGAISGKTAGTNHKTKSKREEGKGKGVSCVEGGVEDKSKTGQQSTIALTTTDEGWMLALTGSPTINGEYLGYHESLCVRRTLRRTWRAEIRDRESHRGGERVGIRRVPCRWLTSEGTQKVTVTFTVAEVPTTDPLQERAGEHWSYSKLLGR